MDDIGLLMFGEYKPSWWKVDAVGGLKWITHAQAPCLNSLTIQCGVCAYLNLIPSYVVKKGIEKVILPPIRWIRGPLILCIYDSFFLSQKFLPHSLWSRGFFFFFSNKMIVQFDKNILGQRLVCRLCIMDHLNSHWKSQDDIPFLD